MSQLYFFLDFDLTIANDRISDIIASTQAGTLDKHELELMQAVNGTPEELKKLEQRFEKETHARWDLLDECFPRGPEDEWKNMILGMIEEGHRVAIISFCSYPLIMRRFLIERVNLPLEIVNQIHITFGIPSAGAKPEGKVNYILETKKALEEKYEETISLEQIRYVDDSKLNCEAAMGAGISSIHAIMYDDDEENEYYDERNDDFFMDLESERDMAKEENTEEEMEAQEEENDEGIEEKNPNQVSDASTLRTVGVFSIEEKLNPIINISNKTTTPSPGQNV